MLEQLLLLWKLYLHENVLHQRVLNVIFRGILELDVLIVAHFSSFNFIKNWVVGNSFKFDGCDR
jgi:hypothetical protein